MFQIVVGDPEVAAANTRCERRALADKSFKTAPAAGARLGVESSFTLGRISRPIMRRRWTELTKFCRFAFMLPFILDLDKQKKFYGVGDEI